MHKYEIHLKWSRKNLKKTSIIYSEINKSCFNSFSNSFFYFWGQICYSHVWFFAVYCLHRECKHTSCVSVHYNMTCWQWLLLFLSFQKNNGLPMKDPSRKWWPESERRHADQPQPRSHNNDSIHRTPTHKIRADVSHINTSQGNKR